MARHGERYRAALERVRLRALRTGERAGSAPHEDRLAAYEAQLRHAEAVLVETAGEGRDARLARQLGLSLDGLDFLWTAVAVSADPRLWPHLQRLGGVEAAKGVSLGLHAMLATLDGERSLALALELGPGSPLVRHRLVESADELAWTARRWAAPMRVAAYLAGDDEVDPLLAEAGGGRVAVPAALELDEAAAEAHARCQAALAGDAAVLLMIDGSPGTGRRTAVAVAAGARGAVALDVARLGPGLAALDRALGALVREAVLTGAVPVVIGADALEREDDPAPLRTLARALDACPGPSAVVTLGRGLELVGARPAVRVSVPVPTTASRRTLWDRALGEAAVTGDERDLLAMRYRLGAGGIGEAVAAARRVRGTLDLAAITDGVRNNIAERMGGLAQRVAVKQSWDELVLGKDTFDQVKGLSARVRHAHTVLEQWGLGSKQHRGNGVAALFSGPPGTGKTMVAGLIARELELELYQVDLSKVVSKWVGETEKQLARIFDAADAGHALLLFDEADALFAKRTEVKAAVDRYANLEVNYLLQRVEAFGGITILTTNLDQSIDPALMRRLAAHVKFWPPELEERVALWKGMLHGKRIPLDDDIDLDELAGRFSDMTGANIRNAAISACFLAAAEGTRVAQAHLERASRGEYASMGRTLSGQRR